MTQASIRTNIDGRQSHEWIMDSPSPPDIYGDIDDFIKAIYNDFSVQTIFGILGLSSLFFSTLSFKPGMFWTLCSSLRGGVVL